MIFYSTSTNNIKYIYVTTTAGSQPITYTISI